MDELPDIHKPTSARQWRSYEASPDDGAQIAARISDLMLDRKKLIDRAQSL